MDNLDDNGQFIVSSSSPHTSIPDWLPFYNGVSVEVRNLLAALLVLSKGEDSPRREDLAQILGVDVRTIYRWLCEAKEAHILSTRRAGRRTSYLLHEPANLTGGSVIVGSVIQRSLIVGSGIHVFVQPDSVPSESDKTAKPDPTITDPTHGGGGGSFLDIDPPPPPRAKPDSKIRSSDIKTPTGQWMVRSGFSLAKSVALQHLPLGPCQSDFSRRWELGQRHGAIALAWEVEPPGEAAPPTISSGPFDLSEEVRARYRAMGMVMGSDEIEEQDDESTEAANDATTT